MRRFVTLAALIIATSACTSSSSTTGVTAKAHGVPLTRIQANNMASMLFKNHDAGGGNFTAEVPYGAAASFTLTGSIDWKKHLGKATLATHLASGASPPSIELYWIQTDSQQVVLLGGIANFEVEMAALGKTGVKYLARPLSDKTPQDIVLKFVNALASTQRDNPQLLQFGDPKNAAAEFLRTDTVNGVPVEVFTQGGKVRFWVTIDTGMLAKVDADLGGFAGPTVITFAKVGPIDLASPQASEVVDAATLPQPVIDRLFPKPSPG